jgi:hypothetical protein
MRLTIDLTDEEVKILKKRGKKNFLELKEQVEDIIRRSCITAKETTGYTRLKPDDPLVEIFSREKRGGFKERKKKKTPKKENNNPNAENNTSNEKTRYVSPIYPVEDYTG